MLYLPLIGQPLFPTALDAALEALARASKTNRMDLWVGVIVNYRYRTPGLDDMNMTPMKFEMRVVRFVPLCL